LVAGSERDYVFDGLFVIDHDLRAESYIHIVITPALEIVPQVSRSLHQQVVIDRPLLKDRNIALENPLRHHGFDGFDIDFRTRCDAHGGAHATVLAIVLKLVQFNLRSETLVFLVFAQNAPYAGARTGFGDLAPPMDEGNTPSSSVDYRVVGE